MGNNQLFREIPPYDLVELILKHFIPDMNSFNYTFSKQDIIQKNIIMNITQHIETLKTYYLKCKVIKYLSDINEKSIITILRQILKPHGFNIKSKEKYMNEQKFLIYSLYKLDNTNYKVYELTMIFD